MENQNGVPASGSEYSINESMSLLDAAIVLPYGDVLLRYAEKARVGVGSAGSAGTVIVVLPVCEDGVGIGLGGTLIGESHDFQFRVYVPASQCSGIGI
tara:strand:- start:17 stop:310 length:294 start_codon:yes stop_codon:yes gene_type:complete